jgi:glycosyltransferase involved in cell wall biosynthesis
MEKLFYDKELYKKIKANTRKSVGRFSVKNIVQEWLKLFEEMSHS